MRWPPGGDVVAPPPGSPRYAHPHPAPRAYPQMLRTWAWRSDWWRAIFGILLLGAGVFVVAPLVLTPVLALAVYVQSSIEHTDFAKAFSTATSLAHVTPATMLWLNLSLASAILITAGLVRFLHHLSPRWLISVRPGVRWRFFFACLALALVALVVSILVSTLLPGDSGDVGGSLNHFGGREIALAVVILLTTPLQAMGEEFAFRGYLMQAFGSLFGSWTAVVVTSLLFAAAHGLQNFPLFFDRFAFGLLAGYLVVRIGGLEAGIALHVLNNYVAFGVALLFGDVGSSLTVSSISWWNIPVTVVQNGLYLVLVILVAKRMGLSAMTSPPDPDSERGSAPPGPPAGPVSIGGGSA